MDGLQTLSLVLLAAAAVLGLGALAALAVKWLLGSSAAQARAVQERRPARHPSPAEVPPAPRAPVPAPTPLAAAAAAPAPGVMRTQVVDLPLFDDEPTAPMMHIDLAPASGWPDTLPPALATMARQYAETQPAEMQKAG